MKLLLDECIPHRLRLHLSGHDAYSVAYMGWGGIKNGRLLALAAADGFEALVTTDRNLEHQQNLATLPLAIVVLEAASNDIGDMVPLVPNLLTALGSLQQRSVTHVS
jgi:predicted nuclease of predicted toxin-antitoxin system